MKILLRSICLLLLLHLMSGVSYAQKKEQPLRVMSYNLRFGELSSMRKIAQYICAEQPAIVALQELDWKANRGQTPAQSGVAMLNELAYHTEMFSLYGKTINFAGGYYGIGILSKYPILSSERVLLPNPEPAKEPRAMLVAQIELPNQQIVNFICTHIEYSTEEHRLAQIRFINKYAKKLKGPVILAGDFNATPEAKEIAQEMKNWIDASSSDFTYHTADPKSKIDYIFALPRRGLEFIHSETPDVKLSDHFPLITDFTIK